MTHRRTRTLLVLVTSLVLIGACAPTTDGDAPRPPEPTPEPTTARAVPERAAPAADVVIGVAVAQGRPDTDTALTTLAGALGLELDTTVELRAFDAYPPLRDALGNRTLQAAFLNANAVVAAMDAGQATPVLVVVRGGATASYGEFYARCAGPYASITDLRGARFAFVAPGSTLGHRAPHLSLLRAGIDPDRDLETVFAGRHDAVVRAVYEGDVDAGATFAGGIDTIAATHADVREVVCSIGTTVAIPNDALVVGPTLDDTAREAFAAAFLRVIERPEASDALVHLVAGAGGLAPASASDYEVVRDLIATFP